MSEFDIQMSEFDLVDVDIRLDAAHANVIEQLARQCGLTRDQMASAIAVLALRRLLGTDGAAA